MKISKYWSEFSQVYVAHIKQDLIICDRYKTVLIYKPSTGSGCMLSHSRSCQSKNKYIDRCIEMTIITENFSSITVTITITKQNYFSFTITITIVKLSITQYTSWNSYQSQTDRSQILTAQMKPYKNPQLTHSIL